MLSFSTRCSCHGDRSLQEVTTEIPQPSSALFCLFFLFFFFFKAFLEHSGSGRVEMMHIYKTGREGGRQAVREGENEWDRLSREREKERERERTAEDTKTDDKAADSKEKTEKEPMTARDASSPLQWESLENVWSPTVNVTLLIFDTLSWLSTRRLNLRFPLPASSFVFSPLFSFSNSGLLEPFGKDCPSLLFSSLSLS